jgi:hypothetical protein
MSAFSMPEGFESPRSERYPNAFTYDELLRGAALAYVFFQLMGMVIVFWIGTIDGVVVGLQTHPVSWAEAPVMGLGYAFGAGVIGLPVSFASLAVGSIGAKGLGMLLRRVRGDRVHVAAFAGYGVVIGAATFVVFDLITDGSDPGSFDATLLWMVIVIPLTCATVALGRLAALTMARADDAAYAQSLAALARDSSDNSASV